MKIPSFASAYPWGGRCRLSDSSVPSCVGDYLICTRLAGVSEFLTVSILATKFCPPVTRHVGDMGQLHQHLALYNHIALEHELLLLEHILHLRSYFAFPAVVTNGVHQTPQEPGASRDLKSIPRRNCWEVCRPTTTNTR